APSPAPSVPAPAAVASKTPVHAPGTVEAGTLSGTVGRDGRQRTPELLAQVVAAPGGFYPPEPPAPIIEVPEKKPKGKKRGAKTAAAPVGKNGMVPSGNGAKGSA